MDKQGLAWISRDYYFQLSFLALGSIGRITEDVVEMLVWSMRYSKEAAVRAQTCNAVAKLGVRDLRVLNVLQDRLMVETDGVVRR
jgi:hypothetical protein